MGKDLGFQIAVACTLFVTLSSEANAQPAADPGPPTASFDDPPAAVPDDPTQAAPAEPGAAPAPSDTAPGEQPSDARPPAEAPPVMRAPDSAAAPDTGSPPGSATVPGPVAPVVSPGAGVPSAAVSPAELPPPEPRPSGRPPLPSELAHARYQDPHVDRIVLHPTAETHPQGTIVYSAYDLFWQRVGYAPTDYLQTNLSITIPYHDGWDTYVLGDLGVKARVYGGSHGAVAVAGGTMVGTGNMIGVWEDTPLFVGRLGAVAQVCIPTDCGVVVVAGVRTFFVHRKFSSDIAVPYGGLVAHLTDWFGLMLEPAYYVPTDGGDALSTFSAGVRFHGDLVAFDLGTSGLFGPEAAGYFTPIGVPFATLTVRNRGDVAKRHRPAEGARRPRWRPAS